MLTSLFFASCLVNNRNSDQVYPSSAHRRLFQKELNNQHEEPLMLIHVVIDLIRSNLALNDLESQKMLLTLIQNQLTPDFPLMSLVHDPFCRSIALLGSYLQSGQHLDDLQLFTIL